ncbi:LacI family transcriptional regulator [Povalibacter uvarum]|uniref:LacI family transcriptional regulator n=1 Tax=Povalibacter uvarum TaxID=732238 RepID=A0A841HUB7_9GAMM|nr:LacI family DNA-binding transcriptional regulator [Povalibacter uvarum]MBB6095435.1 LacI family transcriptional regulator [Povalibacter uvarum]
MMTRPAIGTVAAEARVSIKTVSRVINNSDRVTAATREHVMGVIRRLGYSPSPNARRLAGHRSLLVGLPFDNPYASYVTDVQSGSLASFRAANYQVVMHACDSQSPVLADELRLFVHSVRVDGVLLTPPLSDSAAVIEMLDRDEIPFVRIAPSGRNDPTRSVFAGDRESAAAMTRDLATLGHRRIAFVIGHERDAGTAQRYMGYCDGLRLSKLSLDARWVVEGDGSFEAGIASGRKLLRMRKADRPTAIFASTDLMAAGVLHAAHELGVAVPTALSVAGFGDEPLASQVWPRLTTIRQPLQGLAQQAAAMLMAQLRRDSVPAPAVPVQSSLVIRQSTAVVASRC